MAFIAANLKNTTPSQLQDIQERYTYQSTDSFDDILSEGYFLGAFDCSACFVVVDVTAGVGWLTIVVDSDTGTASNQSGMPAAADVTKTVDAKGVIRVEDFGALNQTNLLTACVYANSVNKAVKSDGLVVVTSEITIPANTVLDGVKLQGSTVRVDSSVVIQNSEINGTIVRLNFDCNDAEIHHNTFTNGAYITALSGSNSGPDNIKIHHNKSILSPLFYGVYINNSHIYENEITGDGASFCISFSGNDNQIYNNIVNGGVTGIICVPLRTSNQKATLNRNKIYNNNVKNTSEEGISIDIRGNSSTDGLMQGGSTIASSSGATITLNNTFSTTVLEKFVVFQNGYRAGESYQITAGSGAGPLTLAGFTANNTKDTGLIISIQLGAFDNEIYENTVENCTLAGVKVWGGFLDTVVRNNTAIDCDIEIDGLTDITSTVALCYSIPHGAKIYDNKTRGGNINLTATQFGVSAILDSVNCEFKDNEAIGGTCSVASTKTPLVSNNKNLTIAIPHYKSLKPSEIVVYPATVVTHNIDTNIYTIQLPTRFGLHQKIKASIAGPQFTGSREFTVSAYRSNETVSKFGSLVTSETLVKLATTPANRDVSDIQCTVDLVTTTTINDTATLLIKIKPILSGSIITGASTCALKVTVESDIDVY